MVEAASYSEFIATCSDEGDLETMIDCKLFRSKCHAGVMNDAPTDR